MLDILVVDDDADVLLSIAETLRSQGHSVAESRDGADAITQIDERPFDLVLSDVRLPKADGFALLRKIRCDWPATDVLLMTAFGNVTEAVLALKENAVDYLAKPFETSQLLESVDRITARRRVDTKLRQAADDLERLRKSGALIGRAPIFQRLKEQLGLFARATASLLITGETGTGKELVARSVHDLGPRADRPFVAINCAAFPLTLLEAELFGHERGAFTGAVQRREGRFQAADGGTLFLDEIAEIPLESQAKLLRVLQEGTFEPIGTNATRKVDVRIISATNRPLKEHVAQGRFREDLYYRLKVLELQIPPLRERPDDLPLLTRHFLERLSPEGRAAPSLSPGAWAALLRHPFPGNVRELEHALHHAVVMARGGDIGLDHLPLDVRGGGPASPLPAETLRPLREAVDDFEREYVRRALDVAHGERGKTAVALGISRKSLWQKLRKFHITA